MSLRRTIGLTLVVSISVGCGGGGGSGGAGGGIGGFGGGAGSSDAGPDAFIKLDGGDGTVTNICPTPTGAGTMHQGRITADETWTAAGNPHIVEFGIVVSTGTLTLEPCVVVRLRDGHSIRVGETSGAPAAIVGHGTSTPNGTGFDVQPIVFQPDDPTHRWGSITVFPTGRADFEVAVLTGGGAQATAQNYGGIIVAGGSGVLPLTQNVRLRSVAISDSGSFGVNLQGYAAFTDDSDDVVITGSGAEPTGTAIDSAYPFYIVPPAVHTIPPGTYTGNAKDEIFVPATAIRDSDETFHNRGIPYHVAGILSLAPLQTAQQGGLQTLTLEAGVILKFEPNPTGSPSLVLGTSGGNTPDTIWPARFVVSGTPTEPVVLTSAAAQPAAGDWVGVEWFGGPATGNSINSLHVEYGGADSGNAGFGCGPTSNDAGFIITNWIPAEDFATDLHIVNSAGGGIVSGWSSDAAGPDLRTGNTFTNLADACVVSQHAAASGACPGNDNIPDCY